ncbi:MAG: response regulator [Spirochaetales bacterium]|nr:response regulator [Spirochaetales bacterium]
MDKIKVLIVDDEPLARRVVRQKVPWSKYGMVVCGEATNGNDALAFLDSQDVDVVFTDIKMPFLNGNELIDKVCKKTKKIKFVVLSAYSDFSLVRSAFKFGVFDYILKSDIDTSRIENLLSRLKESIVHDEAEIPKEKWLVNEVNQRKQLTEDQMRTRSGLITVFEVNTTNLSSIEVISNKIESEISRTIKDFCSTIMEKEAFIILIYHQSPDENNICETKKQMLSLLTNFSGRDIGNDFEVGVSQTGSIGHVHDLLVQAHRACDLNYYKREGFINFYSSISVENCDVIFDLNKSKSKLFDFISHFDFHSVSASFKVLFEKFLEFRVPKDKVCDIILDLYLYTLNHLYDIDLLPADFCNDINKLRCTIYGMSKMNDLKHWIIKNIEEIERFYHGAYARDPISIIENYINLNLEGELSLQELADSFGMGKTYLSFLFSKEKGITLKSFITQKRVERAKEYLESTDLKIKEISQLIGYNNVEHFSRTFKKETDESPDFYRKHT